MGRVRPAELREEGLELETEIGEPLAENPIGGLSLLVGVRPRGDQGSNRLVAVEIPNRHLELVRGGRPPVPHEPDPPSLAVLPPHSEATRDAARGGLCTAGPPPR